MVVAFAIVEAAVRVCVGLVARVHRYTVVGHAQTLPWAVAGFPAFITTGATVQSCFLDIERVADAEAVGETCLFLCDLSIGFANKYEVKTGGVHRSSMQKPVRWDCRL